MKKKDNRDSNLTEVVICRYIPTGYALFCLLSVYSFDAAYCLIALLAGIGGGGMAGKVAIIIAKRLTHKII